MIDPVAYNPDAAPLSRWDRAQVTAFTSALTAACRNRCRVEVVMDGGAYISVVDSNSKRPRYKIHLPSPESLSKGSLDPAKGVGAHETGHAYCASVEDFYRWAKESLPTMRDPENPARTLDDEERDKMKSCVNIVLDIRDEHVFQVRYPRLRKYFSAMVQAVLDMYLSQDPDLLKEHTPVPLSFDSAILLVYLATRCEHLDLSVPAGAISSSYSLGYSAACRLPSRYIPNIVARRLRLDRSRKNKNIGARGTCSLQLTFSDIEEIGKQVFISLRQFARPHKPSGSGDGSGDESGQGDGTDILKGATRKAVVRISQGKQRAPSAGSSGKSGNSEGKQNGRTSQCAGTTSKESTLYQHSNPEIRKYRRAIARYARSLLAAPAPVVNRPCTYGARLGDLTRLRTDLNVFHSRGRGEGINTAVAFLLDISGSMVPIISTTSAAAQGFGEAITDAGAVTRAWVFSSRSKSVRIGDLSKCRDGGGTNMLPALSEALAWLRCCKESRRILMVFSDGDTIHQNRCIELSKEAHYEGVIQVGCGMQGYSGSTLKKTLPLAYPIELGSDNMSGMFRAVRLIRHAKSLRHK